MLRPSFELSIPEYKLEALTLELLFSVHYNAPLYLNSNCLHIRQLPETIKYKYNISHFNSNKSPTRCNSFSVYYPVVYLQLNMFRAFFRPSPGAQRRQWQPLVLPSYRGDSRTVFVVGPTTNTARLSPRYGGKTSGCHCSH